MSKPTCRMNYIINSIEAFSLQGEKAFFKILPYHRIILLRSCFFSTCYHEIITIVSIINNVERNPAASAVCGQPHVI